MIHITCPWCQANLTAPESALGRKGKCHKCGRPFRILDSGAIEFAEPAVDSEAEVPGDISERLRPARIVAPIIQPPIPPQSHQGLPPDVHAGTSTANPSPPPGNDTSFPAYCLKLFAWIYAIASGIAVIMLGDQAEAIIVIAVIFQGGVVVSIIYGLGEIIERLYQLQKDLRKLHP